MSVTDLSQSRERELWRRLEGVNDPELDEPVTEMGFVERAEIAQDGHVEVDFRLPTYWCSPNFAFLMLEDIRAALDALSWAPPFHIALHDHMFAAEVNQGIAAAKSFSEIFDTLVGEGEVDLEALRTKFRLKAFKRRQEAVILGLRAIGLSDVAISTMTLADFDALRGGEADAVKHRLRYREALLARRSGLRPDDRVIVDWDGMPVDPGRLTAYLGELRSVRINMEFNGALCRGLKQTRYKEMEVIDGEPTLVDFIIGRVPPPAAPSHTTDH
ncbi:metal-sulfur cluster biosynthetic enzyme [Rhizobium sp. BK313]|uniref:iron-sulfur cluster assembly protein n=1 Tax=Rhizobium sp. BK313 TaxID=2587081 RepID=UPI00105FC1FA|nr:iron-sulfur cluster assembly protein [Rhizobium sp. BK313]MBB3454637.1 metal-sulfur cluster biosynthetic enzyme [Rhizobium sp. BK313]